MMELGQAILSVTEMYTIDTVGGVVNGIALEYLRSRTFCSFDTSSRSKAVFPCVIERYPSAAQTCQISTAQSGVQNLRDLSVGIEYLVTVLLCIRLRFTGRESMHNRWLCVHSTNSWPYTQTHWNSCACSRQVLLLDVS